MVYLRGILTGALAAMGLLLLASGRAYSAQPGPASQPAGGGKKINVVVLTGGHGFEKDPFLKVFEGFDDIAATHVAQKVGGEVFDDISGWSYDVILLYNYNQKLTEAQRQNLLKLLDKGVGFFVLHHAIAGYTVDWPLFSRIMGAKYFLGDVVENGVKLRSGWKEGVSFKVHIEDANHPVTAWMSDFDIVDENYSRYRVDPNVHVLLTTDSPTSDKAIGWVKTYGKARVACTVLGHDSAAYKNKGFLQVVAQMIRWTAGRLPEGSIAPSGPAATSRPDK